ncbi:MAG: hypothetical protein K2X82_14970 [Gemmataceae bacterium]|nr:hypothetical protein [Gemmataceae bacterium]
MSEVDWSDEAFAEVAAMLVANPDRQIELAIAVGTVVGRLSKNPEQEGESRWGDLRVTFVGPLIVYFRVSAGGRSAEVAQVRLTG